METKFVTCYFNPDLDGYACVQAYAEYLNAIGEIAKPMIFGVPHDEVKFVLQKFDIAPISLSSQDEPVKNIILVDSSDLAGLDKSLSPDNVIEIIDHRAVNDADQFPNAKLQIELVGAAAALIAEKFIDGNIAITAASAALLYSAIISNTLNFKAKITTERDSKAARWLNTDLNLTDQYAKEMFSAKSDLSGGKLRLRLRGDFAHFRFNDRPRIGIGQIEMIEADKLVSNRKSEILSELEQIKAEYGLDHIFLSIIDLEAEYNLFITTDKKMQSVLSSIFEIEFIDAVAKRPSLIMRKEIVPLLKNYFNN